MFFLLLVKCRWKLHFLMSDSYHDVIKKTFFCFIYTILGTVIEKCQIVSNSNCSLNTEKTHVFFLCSLTVHNIKTYVKIMFTMVNFWYLNSIFHTLLNFLFEFSGILEKTSLNNNPTQNTHYFSVFCASSSI